MCVSKEMSCVHGCSQARRGVRSLGAEVTGGFEPSDVSDGNCASNWENDL